MLRTAATMVPSKCSNLEASGPRLYESTRSSRGRNTAEITQRDSRNCEGQLSNRRRNCHSLMGTATLTLRASGSSFQRQTLRPEASEIRLSDRGLFFAPLLAWETPSSSGHQLPSQTRWSGQGQRAWCFEAAPPQTLSEVFSCS